MVCLTSQYKITSYYSFHSFCHFLVNDTGEDDWTKKEQIMTWGESRKIHFASDVRFEWPQRLLKVTKKPAKLHHGFHVHLDHIWLFGCQSK